LLLLTLTFLTVQGFTFSRRRTRVRGRVDRTRSRNGATDRDAPGWSPAAAGQRTRAAWSGDPYRAPASGVG